MKYYYEALNREGLTVKGEMEAESQKKCVQEIREEGLFPTEVRIIEEPNQQPELSLMEMFLDTIRNVWNKR